MIKGDVKCNGAVLRCTPDGSDLELVAWGLRNPYGIAFHPDGRLFATEHGSDERAAATSWAIWRTSTRSRRVPGTAGPTSPPASGWTTRSGGSAGKGGSRSLPSTPISIHPSPSSPSRPTRGPTGSTSAEIRPSGSKETPSWRSSATSHRSLRARCLRAASRWSASTLVTDRWWTSWSTRLPVPPPSCRTRASSGHPTAS
ncbi:MAG: PQQ-dependent sugar dehydrogenase, partial [Chloroflexota bacterium]|nr:PQQ-dependent sugar dehydrogenase [Chloroflexota bacterium]